MNLITSNAVARVGRYFSTSCSTSASEQIKEITIENLTLVNGDIIGVTFSNENSYGDCTLTTPTYPSLKLNSGSAIPICDSLGHTVGKGCWNSGDYIELRYCGDKFIIINSDVRQKSDNYIINSNNYCKQWGYSTTSTYGAWISISYTPKFKTLPNIKVTMFDSATDRSGGETNLKDITVNGFSWSFTCRSNQVAPYKCYWQSEGYI